METIGKVFARAEAAEAKELKRLYMLNAEE